MLRILATAAAAAAAVLDGRCQGVATATWHRAPAPEENDVTTPTGDQLGRH
jgi:hypothetical protein